MQFFQVFLTPFGIPIAVFIWLTISAIAEAVTNIMCNRNSTELKLELLARGFSAQEIIGIIQAGGEVDQTPVDDTAKASDAKYASA